MEALTTHLPIALPSLITANLPKPVSSFLASHKRSKLPLLNLTQVQKSKFTKCNVIPPSVSTQPEAETEPGNLNPEDEKFDWFSNWYPLMPVCDLDKRAPHGMKVLGLEVVVWWDKNENAWKVFDDRCPHRSAPLSEGRIDQWGRLQCVYHGWCFGGSGDCKFIPQAPRDGPPVHSYPKACAAVYPSTMRYGIVWFWPNTDPQYQDILTKKKPPYIPELESPSFAFQIYNRDIPLGYEVLLENLMDPAHIPYAHHGIMNAPQPSVKLDREGGTPIDMRVQKFDKNGITTIKHPDCTWNFISPCLFHFTDPSSTQFIQGKLAKKPTGEGIVIFLCIPVSPGNSRLIIFHPRSFWASNSIWVNHMIQNLIIDSDLYLLRVQEEKLMEAGPLNWQKACFVPTKSDTMVALFRTWLKKYAGGQVDWGTKYDGSLPPIPPKEQLLDRYWSHVVNCSSCNGAYKGLNALRLSLQVFSVAAVAIVAATKEAMIPAAARNTLAIAAVLCFVGSKWLSRFIYKNFHFHDYNHAFK